MKMPEVASASGLECKAPDDCARRADCKPAVTHYMTAESASLLHFEGDVTENANAGGVLMAWGAEKLFPIGIF